MSAWASASAGGISVAEARKGWKNLKLQFAVGMVLGVAVMAAVAIFADVSAVAKEARHIGPWYFAAACALSLVNYLLRFAKWHFYLGRLGLGVPLRDSFLTFMSGLSMSVTPGKLGELLKALILRVTRGVPVAQTSPVVIAERATDSFGLLVLMAVGSLSFSYGKSLAILLTAASVLFVIVVQRRELATRLFDALERGRLGRRMGEFAPSLRIFHDSSYRLFLPQSLVPTTLMSALSWGMEGVAFSLILSGLGLHLPIAKTIFIFSSSTLIGAISMLPGGLGVADGSLLGLLAREGIPKASAGSAALIVRLATLWLAVLVGVIALTVSVKVGFLRGGLGSLRLETQDSSGVPSRAESSAERGSLRGS